jgi:hypothetical protein
MYQIQCPNCNITLSSKNHKFQCIPCGINIESQPLLITRMYAKCRVCGEDRAGNGYCKQKHTWPGHPGPLQLGF